MLRSVVCARGEDAARMFYGHPGRFTRRGAMPQTALRLLQDKDSVQWLQGKAHHHRKTLFLAVMSPDGQDGSQRIRQLSDAMAQQWRAHFPAGQGTRSIGLHDQVREIICRAVCQWTGIPLSDAQTRQRTGELSAMIDASGSVGPRNWRAQLLRWRTERWAREVITAARQQPAGAMEADLAAGSPLRAIAAHRNLEGKLLDPQVAAVELINVLRPTVAVARYITFAALALHEHPECREPLLGGENGYLQWFVQEVRRYYPFFPVIGGRVQQPFDWRDHHFAQGQWVLLDLYGTNHDVRCWDDPERFRPERFANWDGSGFNFIPQGGGDHQHGHRCPGEWITIELTRRAVMLLASEMQYEVPEQDLRIDLSRLPTLPASGFRVSNVRWRPEA